MKEINITINSRVLCWVVILILQAAFIAWYQGILTVDAFQRAQHSPGNLVMSEAEARLVRQAIELVREDVVRGSLRSTDLTRQALSALLPRAVREAVITELGHPDMEFMRDALDILDGKIVIRK